MYQHWKVAQHWLMCDQQLGTLASFSVSCVEFEGRLGLLAELEGWFSLTVSASEITAVFEAGCHAAGSVLMSGCTAWLWVAAVAFASI